MVDISPILAYLRCPTPDLWVEKALQNMDVILLDHAANEMKAAQSAMTLMSRNPTKIDLLNKMSRLAREELVHFEQVLKILRKRKIEYRPLKASRYASQLAQGMRADQQSKFIDTMIVGSIIEARSCERFAAIAPHLDAELNKFYISLLKSESRHFQDYLSLAQQFSKEDIAPRVELFLDLEQATISSPDPLLRFHSGVPVEISYDANGKAITSHSIEA